MEPTALSSVGAGVAFLAGLTFFFSPCVWPLYPAYLAYLAGSVRTPRPLTPAATGGAGASSTSASSTARPPALWSRALGFILGFSLVFIALGASASAVGQWLFTWQPLLRRAAGILIGLAGLALLLLSFPWQGQGGAGLWAEWRPFLNRWGQKDRGQWLASIFLGASFSIGWTPCLGPVLTAILAYAATTATLAQGIFLLAIFSLGFALPFLILAALLPRLTRPATRRSWWRAWGEAAGVWGQRLTAVVLIIMGYLVGSGQLDRLAAWLTRWVG
ncbi:MAG: cytochrome c biogenesis protein CcdA [Limnochordaceae bacterium]|nr:cytochrome c biogenesis protein CcdA [Limnochordaceae bacterium]